MEVGIVSVLRLLYVPTILELPAVRSSPRVGFFSICAAVSRLHDSKYHMITVVSCAHLQITSMDMLLRAKPTVSFTTTTVIPIGRESGTVVEDPPTGHSALSDGTRLTEMLTTSTEESSTETDPAVTTVEEYRENSEEEQRMIKCCQLCAL